VIARALSAPILLIVGVVAVAVAIVAGRTDLYASELAPPFAARVMLGLAATVIGVVVVLRAADRVSTDRDARGLIRAVRLVFVSVGAFAAAAGWLIGSPVPIVAGLVIVGVDLLETSFLLVVTAVRGSEYEEAEAETGSPVAPTRAGTPSPD
jgi:hypothetical protein